MDRTGAGEGPAHVLSPILQQQAALRRRGAQFDQEIFGQWEPDVRCHLAGQEGRLIEPALPEAAAVERDGNDQICRLQLRIASRHLSHQPAEGGGQRPPATKLERVNRLPQRAVVDARGSGRRKVRPPAAAGNAGEQEVRRTAERPTASSADRRVDDAYGATAGRTQREQAGRAAHLASRGKQQIDDAAERRHTASLGGLAPSLPDPIGLFWRAASDSGSP